MAVDMLLKIKNQRKGLAVTAGITLSNKFLFSETITLIQKKRKKKKKKKLSSKL